MTISKTTTNLSTLKINHLTKQQYQTALDNNEINANELYVTTEGDMSAQEITALVNSLSFSQLVAADYIVQEGTSGSWTWRKWNSGIGECWLQYNPGSYTCGTTRGSLYSGGNLTLTYPITFVSIPTATGNVSLGTGTYVVWLQFNGLGTSTAQVRIVGSASIAANSNYLISVHVIGRWK